VIAYIHWLRHEKSRKCSKMFNRTITVDGVVQSLALVCQRGFLNGIIFEMVGGSAVRALIFYVLVIFPCD